MVKKVRMSLNKEFVKAIPIIEKLEENGFQAFFVGGSVRDTLLNKASHDVDIATSAFPEEIKQIFRRTIDVGIEHGTVMVLLGNDSYEITTFRTESTYQDYRRPDSVTFVRSLEQDLMRRDFTVNALAMDKKGIVYDYFDGLKDLENGVIRAVGDPYTRFNEDGLRMMRAVRFQATLAFEIEQNTLSAIEQNSDILSKIAVERVHEEFIKLMLGKNKSNAIKSFIETDLYTHCPGFSDHEDTLYNLSALPDDIQSEIQVWALFAYYSKLSADELRMLLKKWKSSNAVINDSINALQGLRESLVGELSKLSIYQLGKRILLNIEWMVHLITGNDCDRKTIDIYDSLPIHKRSEMAIDGDILMTTFNKKGGPWLGELIDDMEKKVVYGNLDNDTESLLAYAEGKILK